MKRLPLFAFIILQMLSAHKTAFAQDAADALAEINKLKLDGDYIWAEGTSRMSEKEALDNAHAVLEFEIQNWIKTLEEKDVAGVVMPTNDQCMNIKTKRGKLYRSFVYVPKNLIMPYYKNEKVVVVENANPTPDQAEMEIIEEVPYEPSAFETEMLSVKTGNEMTSFFKSKGITRHGKFKDRPLSGTYYVFLYDKNSNIRACLKSCDNTITNITTGKPDTYSNYKDCFARWFIYEKQ